MSEREIRRGRAAIKEVEDNRGSGSGSFRPFLPNIYWKDDGESKYLLFLTPIEEIPLFDTIGFIPTEDGHFDSVIAKTDPYLDESKDAFVDDWDATPRAINYAIAVELDAVTEVVKGYKRPVGFEITTREFERKVLDEDGDVTDENEEVTVPAIGLVAQSPTNFFNILQSVDAEDYPVDQTPVKARRVGEGNGTTYSFEGFPDQEIDLSNLFEYMDGINYIQDDLEEIEEEIKDLEPAEGAYRLATILLDKRIAEMADPDRYDELLAGVKESLDRFGKKKTKKATKKPERKARTPQRRARPAKKEEEDKPKRTARKSSDGDDAEAQVRAKLGDLKKRAAAKRSKDKEDE